MVKLNKAYAKSIGKLQTDIQNNGRDENLITHPHVEIFTLLLPFTSPA
jgi:hypothetical protein